MAFPVLIKVDADDELEALPAIYRFFGADEPNYAYMKDGEQLLADLGRLGNTRHQVYFRTHNLLTSGDGTPALKWGSTNAYTEDADGNPVYDWTILDRIFDAYLERGIKPYVQIGFMPEMLSTNPKPYQHSWTSTAKYDEIYTGWTYPPKDFSKWQELVYQWTKHCVTRYGKAEVESWYWETWNEPNIGYWQGTDAKFLALHDHAIAGVRRALPTARVGGPEVAGGGQPLLKTFLEHCLHGINAATGSQGPPLDFVSFHAKGRPEFLPGPNYVRMGIATHLSEIDSGFKVIASFAEYKDTPIVIGESDPEGAAAAQGPELGYRNGTMYSSYTAASFARKHDLAAKHGVNLEGALTWAFEFEEQPYFAGFRVLASNDIHLPVFNVFKMFALLGDRRVKAQSSAQIDLETIVEQGVRKDPDVGVLATVDSDTGVVGIMVWHYHDDDVQGPYADVELRCSLKRLMSDVGSKSSLKVSHYRIDDKHSNSYSAWLRMGSPQQPSPEEYKSMQSASELARIVYAEQVDIKDQEVRIGFALPRQGISLILLQPLNGVCMSVGCRKRFGERHLAGVNSDSDQI